MSWSRRLFRSRGFQATAAVLGAQYLRLVFTAAIPQGVIFRSPVPDAFLRFKAHDWDFGFNLGVLADFGETRVGLTYRSGVDHRIEGFLKFTGASPLAFDTVSG